jgi:hypothetical protein
MIGGFPELAERVAALEGALAEVRRMAAGGEADAVISADLAELSALEPAELMDLVTRRVRAAQKDNRRGVRQVASLLDPARRAVRELLGRSLGADERARALTWAGRVHVLEADPATAEHSFRDARDLSGLATDVGREAAHELAYAIADQERHLQAAETFLEIVREPSTAPGWRVVYRLWAGQQLALAGDREGARTQYETTIREHEASEDPHVQRWVGFARAALEDLERR